MRRLVQTPSTRSFLPILVALTLLAAAPLVAEEEAIGTWKLHLELGGRQVEPTLEIVQGDAGLTGTWTGMRGTSELGTVRFAGGQLSFTRQAEFQGQQVEMSFTGKVEGDLLTGQLTTPRASVPVLGTRVRGAETPPAAGEQAAGHQAAGHQAEEAIPTELVASALPVDQAREFVGTWLVKGDFQGNTIDFGIDFQDVSGKLAARLVSPQGEQAISDIARTDEGLVMKFRSGFGPLVIRTRLEGDLLKGSFGDEGGTFSTDIAGARGELPRRVGARRGAGGGLFRRARPETSIAVGDKTVKVEYTEVPLTERGYGELAGLERGGVVRFYKSPAIKLWTDLELRFGEALIKPNNVAEEYPGVYGLWLKKVDDGWHLVFNERPDVWGTMYMPEADVAEVPLRYARAEEADASGEAAKLAVALASAEAGAGTLTVSWGEHRWSTSFEIAP